MEINKKLRLKEELNKKYFLENPIDDIQYPHLDDTQLQKKISLKKEFLYKYDGELKDVASYSKIVCKIIQFIREIFQKYTTIPTAK
jgi:hypothetical protein